MKHLLLMSSSRKGDMGYLEHAREQMRLLLQDTVKRALFIPYAAVSFSFDEYIGLVRPVFSRLGVELVSIHECGDGLKALDSAEALVVGGGNTFALLKRLYDNKLVEAVRERVENSMPYMGWSAGSNVACPSIRTTNDMPIMETGTLAAFNLIPFQINPHFISGKPAGHNGESREERLVEFLAANPKESVLALREGSALHVQGENATLLGDTEAIIFRQGNITETVAPGDSISLNYING